MRKILVLLVLLLLPMTACAQIIVVPETAAVGDLVYIQIEDDTADTWAYRMTRDDELVFEGEGYVRQSGFFRPAETGKYTFYATAQDENGEAVRYEKSFSVLEAWNENGDASVPIVLLGDSGFFHTQGGVKSWIVNAPASWTASTEADFIHIRQEWGDSGDRLVIAIENSGGVYREGSVTISAAGYTLELPVTQSSGTGIETDEYLTETDDTILVDGADCLSWLDAEGERTFGIIATGPWQAVSSADFVQVERGEALRISVTENEKEEMREAWVMLQCGQATACIYIQQTPQYEETTAETIVADTMPSVTGWAAEQGVVIYSQQDGWWKDKQYRDSNLEHSGCAIFTLSHALQLLGYEGDAILPENLAMTYAFCLLEGGTMNSTLIGHAGEDFGFKTRYDLYNNLNDIRSKMEQGAVFSFSVVNGHIAFVAGMSEDGSKFRIIDSAPSATMERIKNGQIYYQDGEGNFVPIQDLSQLPGAVYFFETNAYGGCEYFLDAAYVAKRGVRLIQPIETE